MQYNHKREITSNNKILWKILFRQTYYKITSSEVPDRLKVIALF